MSRLFFAALTALMAQPSLAQAPATGPYDCTVTINSSPSSWILKDHDPFGNQIPEGTYGVTFTNIGTGDCQFTPIFQLDDPSFGLSNSEGQSVDFIILNLSEGSNATPRLTTAVRNPSLGELRLAPNESRTILYRLAVDPTDIQDDGRFSQNVTLEAQDPQFRTVGSTKIALGIDILPSARIGLSGAYTLEEGYARIDLGELRRGRAAVPLALRVESTGRYTITVTSTNSGRLRLGGSEWFIPYSLEIGGDSVELSGSTMVSSPSGTGVRQDSLPIYFFVGDTSNRRAGTYSDVISVAISAQP